MIWVRRSSQLLYSQRVSFTTQKTKMSAEEEIPDTEADESGNKGKKSAKHDSGAADLEKVTDYVEEAEISSQDIGEVMKYGRKCRLKKHVICFPSFSLTHHVFLI